MKHAAGLRLSLLVSLGLVPLACAGTIRHGDGDGGASGEPPTTGTGGESPSAGGASAVGGTTPAGGVPNVAGTTGRAGAPPTAGAGGAVPTAVCSAPMTDPLTGLVSCEEGYSHRPSAKRCDPANAPVPSVGGQSSFAEGGAGGADGASDPVPGRRAPEDMPVYCEGQAGQCEQFELGYCAFSGQVRMCRSGCWSDFDCGIGQICVCGSGTSPSGGECVTSACNTDAECGPGSACASYTGLCGGSGFACLKPDDECRSGSDCKGGTCSWNSSKGHRYCDGAVCGRPFLVETEARVAKVVTTAEWSAVYEASPRVDHLTDAERSLLAEHWTRMGQMEHASIAAFARFSLQLLALGAPPELVEACTRALADETAHTKLCFRIAGVYAGRAIGPGPLDVSGNLLPTSLVDIVELVIAEGCFGETSAALEALDAADSASDPVIAAAYARIAADEQRHAELAFQFVRWAQQQAEHDVAGCIARAIATPPSRDPGALEVAVPCLEQLLAA